MPGNIALHFFFGLGKVLYGVMPFGSYRLLSLPWNIEMIHDTPEAKLDQQAALRVEAKG